MLATDVRNMIKIRIKRNMKKLKNIIILKFRYFQ
nr:MAG TPA: hypothetical protein [Caudoviricetes sp.]